MSFSIAVDTPLGVCWVTVGLEDFDKFLSCFESYDSIESCEETYGYVRYSKSYIYKGSEIACKYWLGE